MASPKNNLFPHRKLALIIGNGNYRKECNRLNQSTQNANDLSDLLKRIAFDVTMHVNVNTDMMKLVKSFCEKIKQDDFILFYFVGHGCQADNKNYLIPLDDSRINAENDVADIGTELQRIMDRLIENNLPYVTICILDCCVPYKLTCPPTSVVEAKPLHGIHLDPEVSLQIVCTTNEDVSGVRGTGRNCLFTKHLLRNIKRSNVDTTTMLQDVVNNVYRENNQMHKPIFLNGLPGNIRAFLNRVSYTIPNIPYNAKWRLNAKTVAGGAGPDSTLDRLHCPKGLYVDKSKNLFIADSLNHRIMKYSPDGTIVRRILGKNISGYGSNRLCGPSNIIYNHVSKNFIISDFHNQRILRLIRKTKTCAKEILRGSGYCGLAMDDDGFLYVSDTERHEVRRYGSGNPLGKVVAGGNGQGSRLNQLNNPTYIFVGPDQAVYVSDSWNDRVVKWDRGATQGIVVAGGQGKGKGKTQLYHPTGLIVDQVGTLYVADYRNNRVMRWYRDASHGNIIVGSIFLAGNKANELSGPEGLAFDHDGNLYVSDSNNHRIQRFRIQTV
ncbi:unnamed protein product [Rotaria socialis]|uniref:Caspase family p20 domain-containing protein n=1 Tax=Rotaria socialis TaxID=392032 RepID=A0A817S1C9_9BILA|nr:unnamed protein product [Rotaria socialis]CAF4440512.1 unnamed protein product [Rotaria socialis]